MEELRGMEPIFHTAAFGTTAEEFERRMDAEYWEVGASGRRYSRGFILKMLAERPPVDVEAAGWSFPDWAMRELGTGVNLLTYMLRQGERVTRRATIWRRNAKGWQILYHQGTMVSGEDDPLPPAEDKPRG